LYQLHIAAATGCRLTVATSDVLGFEAALQDDLSWDKVRAPLSRALFLR
jgi:hypothetical protein